MEESSQTGGNLYDEGGYGCVFMPPLLCAGEKKSDAGTGIGAPLLDKLLKKEDADDEYAIGTAIQKIPLWRQYMSVPEHMCTPAPLSQQVETEMGECKLIGRLPLGKMRILRSSFAGVPLAQLKLSIPTFSFFDFMVHLLEGVSLLSLFGIVHRDLHLGNILVDRANVPRIIDFNLALSARNPEAAGARMHHQYRPDLIQVSPDWCLLNAVAGGKNGHTTMEDMFRRNPYYKSIQAVLGIDEEEQREALRTFYEKSRSAQTGDMELWFKSYWRLIDAWSVGCDLTYLVSKLELWPTFQKTDYREHKEVIGKVLRKLTAFNPLERIDSVQALAMLNPDSYVLRKYASVWLDKVGRV
jgi:serine/threonine protein kinase